MDLALIKQKGYDIPIYTDSMTALSWVRKKKHNSVILPSPPIWWPVFCWGPSAWAL